MKTWILLLFQVGCFHVLRGPAPIQIVHGQRDPDAAQSLNYMTVLPDHCEVIAVNAHGKGSWSEGYKILVQCNGDELKYFLKVLLILDTFPRDQLMLKIITDNPTTSPSRACQGRVREPI